MRTSTKLRQLQIRVSAQEKAAIRSAARRAGMDMSSYVLSRVLSVPAREFQDAVKALRETASPAFALAHIHSLLCRLAMTELTDAVATAPEDFHTPFLANYVASLVETACHRCGVPAPAWTQRIAPLDEPAFGSALQSLRLHLLTHSPAPFRRRNIFIDASLGSQV